MVVCHCHNNSFFDHGKYLFVYLCSIVAKINTKTQVGNSRNTRTMMPTYPSQSLYDISNRSVTAAIKNAN
jgi:hypothetical protein